MSDPKHFVDLQAGFYNALSQGLGFSPSDPFQIIQPSPSLVGGDTADQDLWAYLNDLPPNSLTMNTALSGGNQYLANYQAVMSALQSGNNNFEATVGPQCSAAYHAALKSGDVKPGAMNFRNWALYNGTCSSVAVSGASALAAAMLDPVFAAQMKVAPYKPVGDDSVDFSESYEKLRQLLKKAPSRKFSVAASQWNSDVSNTWSQGSNSGFFGLWGGSSSQSTLSEKFASSGVTLDAKFDNVLIFAPTPGDWYTSSALGLAYNNKGKAPWIPGNAITWETTFGPSGNMQRFMANIVVVSGMTVVVTSSASYSSLEQTEIRSNSQSGLWPFYSSGGSSGSSTSAAFDASGNMTVKITSKAGVPVVIGGSVLSASAYLGAEKEASEQLSRLFYAA